MIMRHFHLGRTKKEISVYTRVGLGAFTTLMDRKPRKTATESAQKKEKENKIQPTQPPSLSSTLNAMAANGRNELRAA